MALLECNRRHSCVGGEENGEQAERELASYRGRAGARRAGGKRGVFSLGTFMRGLLSRSAADGLWHTVSDRIWSSVSDRIRSSVAE
jgi:hypothetical protein